MRLINKDHIIHLIMLIIKMKTNETKFITRSMNNEEIKLNLSSETIAVVIITKKSRPYI